MIEKLIEEIALKTIKENPPAAKVDTDELCNLIYNPGPIRDQILSVIATNWKDHNEDFERRIVSLASKFAGLATDNEEKFTKIREVFVSLKDYVKTLEDKVEIGRAP